MLNIAITSVFEMVIFGVTELLLVGAAAAVAFGRRAEFPIPPFPWFPPWFPRLVLFPGLKLPRGPLVESLLCLAVLPVRLLLWAGLLRSLSDLLLDLLL